MWRLHFTKQYIKPRRQYFTAIRKKKKHLLSDQRETFMAWQKSRGYVKMTTSQYRLNNLGQGESVCERFKNPSQCSSMQVQDILFSLSAYNSRNTMCLLLRLLSGGRTLYMCRCVDKSLHTHTYTHNAWSLLSLSNIADQIKPSRLCEMLICASFPEPSIIFTHSALTKNRGFAVTCRSDCLSGLS